MGTSRSGSGSTRDLAYLAIRSAEMLDKAGFPDTTIVLSSGLDELAIWQILRQIEDEAPRYGMDAAGVIGRLTYGSVPT